MSNYGRRSAGAPLESRQMVHAKVEAGRSAGPTVKSSDRPAPPAGHTMVTVVKRCRKYPAEKKSRNAKGEARAAARGGAARRGWAWVVTGAQQ